MGRLMNVLALVQLLFGLRVWIRLLRTAGGTRIGVAPSGAVAPGSVSILLPVLNERERVGPCLEGLMAQGDEVREILVVDGGSTDGTRNLVRRMATRDPRFRFVDAAPIPAWVNGKSHGLEIGLRASDSTTPWVLTVDADVRPAPELTRSLVSTAETRGVAALSAATLQRVVDGRLGMIHPAMLATLVYRFGVPGSETADGGQVQANGQCFLARRSVLEEAGGFSTVMHSSCEDVALARRIASAGHRLGFYETDGLVSVEMYTNWHEAWNGWSRSLPLNDGVSRWSNRAGLAEVLLAQALPLWLAPVSARLWGARHLATRINFALCLTRLGVLAGMARAYDPLPRTYWLSPLLDLPVALRISQMSRRRGFWWRGRFVSARGSL